MSTYLIIYSSSGAAANIKSAADTLHKYSGATIKDVSGVTTGDITTYCGTTLVDNTYDAIFICCVTQSAGATGLLSFNQVALLDAKLKTAKKGTVVNSGDAQTNATVTEIVLDSTASTTNDAYNGMFIKTAGTTAVYRYISDYVGSTKTCTVTTTTTAITTTETYIVYTNANIHELGNVSTTTGKTAVLQAWDLNYPDVTYPLVNFYLGGATFAVASGTAQAVAAGTITLATTVATGNQMTQAAYDVDGAVNDMYVYVYSATTGASQYRKITDYNATTRVATLESNWGITPTGTVVYRVVKHEHHVYMDRVAEIMTLTYMYDIDSTDALIMNTRLIDNGAMLNLDGIKNTDQDLDYLFGDYTKMGKSTFLSDALAVV